jgi:hypothetical protein
VAAKGILSAEIHADNKLKSHSRRDFSIAGVKALSQGQDEGKPSLLDLLEHGMTFLWMTGHS